MTLSLLPATETHIIALIHSSRSPLHLKQIHARLLRCHLASLPYPATQLIAASVPLRCIPFALTLFHLFPSPIPPLFDALIRALADSSHFPAAAHHFILMPRYGFRPGRLAFPFALRSAAALNSPSFTSSLHAVATKSALDLDTFVRTTLVDAYVKLNISHYDMQLFDETSNCHKASNTLLCNISINACCLAGDMDRARSLFASMPEKSLSTWNKLIHGFVREGDLEEAFQLFEKMPDRNVVSWTTMVAGLSQNGEYKRALSTFDRMVEAGVRPNDYTLASALSACSGMGALSTGVWIHEYAERNGLLGIRVVGTALVDMYSKCGKICQAKHVFDQMRERDILTWTAMIMGYAMQGQLKHALQCFAEMKSAGIKPDEGALLAVLIACSHLGKVKKGIRIFNSLRLDYGIELNLKHYSCIVDLLGKAGRLQEALDFMKAMPIEADYKLWSAFFCACRAHNNVPLAKLAAKKILKLKPMDPGGTPNAERVRSNMKERRVAKSQGWSNIEIEGVTHHFAVGDRSHVCLHEIHTKLEELEIRARKEGYKPNTAWLLRNIEDDEKEDTLGQHSEKLALAFGLILTTEGTEIRIVKNLRVCGDCHAFMKFVSKICGRVILLRDNKRFHHFKEGECSCGDYW